MEQRVTRLEQDMKEVKSLLGDKIMPMLISINEQLKHTATKEDLAELKGRVSQLPTTLQMIGFVLAVLGIAGLAKYFAP